MKQKLDELEKIEQEYRDFKNQIELLQKSIYVIVVETVNKDCMKFNFKDLERIDCNPNYCQKKIELQKLLQKLSEIAVEYMDKYIE